MVRTRKKISNQEKINLRTRAIGYAGGKCVDCGLQYRPPRSGRTLITANSGNADVFDFHHVIFPKRYEGVSDMISRGRDWNLIKSEIDKCVLLCSNCHRTRHAKERNNFAVINLSKKFEDIPLFKDFLQ